MTRAAAALLLFAVLDCALRANAYPSPTIYNETPYPVSAGVEYYSCEPDNIKGISPNGGSYKFQAYRGVCLISKVWATLELGDGKFKGCNDWPSSGSGYDTFYVSGNADKCQVEHH